LEHKSVELADLKIDSRSGEFSGYASIFGNIDGGGDIVVPGAFKKSLPAFLQDGFISWSHDWAEPIAMPTKAYEDKVGLVLAGTFHSTPEAQRARTISAERLAAGKRMGLSIGYGVEEEEFSPKGRLLKVINPLYEVGFVTVPMNREANLSAVKAANGGNAGTVELRDLALDSGTSLAESVARFLGDGEALLKQFQAMADLRQKEGRTLSTANRRRLAELRDAIDGILAETDPDKSANSVLAVLERARSLGMTLS
jgi:HK97 family phage prohead protease